MPGIINGRVMQGAGIPVAFARVNLHSEQSCTEKNLVHSMLTDEDGRYEFRDIDAQNRRRFATTRRRAMTWS